jgi:hypothetical protein
MVVSAHLNYGTLPKASIQYLINHFPLSKDLISKYAELENVKVTELEEDLSFDSFWKKYNHKVGNKRRAMKLWDLLSDDQKAAAIAYLRVYDTYLAMNNGMAKLYPETYLNQERWNN